MIRRGVAAIVFRRVNDKKRYLILKRKLNWKGWEWMKGGCKTKEKEAICLVREMNEELGIQEFLFEKTKHVNSFKYSKELKKDHKKWTAGKNRVYLVEVFSSKFKFDKKEHSGAKWVSRSEALKKITWNDQRTIFNKLTKK